MHSVQGSDWAPSVAVAWVMRKFQAGYGDSLAFVKNSGREVKINKCFFNQFMHWQSTSRSYKFKGSSLEFSTSKSLGGNGANPIIRALYQGKDY